MNVLDLIKKALIGRRDDLAESAKVKRAAGDYIDAALYDVRESEAGLAVNLVEDYIALFPSECNTQEREDTDADERCVVIDEDIALGLDRALEIVKAASGVLYGYDTDDGISECKHATEVLKKLLGRKK